MGNERRALVFGDDTRSFLATVRSLARRGVEVHAAPYDLTSPSLRSKYISRVHLLPYYLEDGAGWRSALSELLEEYRFDLVVPCEERSLLPLARHREAFLPLTRLAIPDDAAMTAFFDKQATHRLGRDCGVPMPDMLPLTPEDSAASLRGRLGLPLVIKPRRSYDWSDLYVRKAAVVIEDFAALEAYLLSLRGNREDWLAEAYFPGAGGGLSVLCDRGRVLQAFEHRRDHEIAGSSYYRRSVEPDAARLAAVCSMAERVGFTGLAMFEYKVDPASGHWRLLEVNARPWGSMPLPVALGVDFPYFLFRLLVDGVVEPRAAYRTGVYGRNLLPDFWQLRTRVARGGRPLLFSARTVAEWLWEFRRLPLGREVHDTWVSDDIAPALAEIRAFLADRFEGLPLLARTRDARQAARDRAFVDRLVRENRASDILFLCQGNICRSPYAAQRMSESRAGSQVESAGMLPRNPRPSPSFAIDAARARGIDLAPHRSRHATRELAARADLIVLFDHVNLRHLKARYPDLAARCVYLGAFDPDAGPLTIEDPEGHDVDVFAATYARIDRCVRHLANRLNITP